jgi:hypothetical protein
VRLATGQRPGAGAAGGLRLAILQRSCQAGIYPLTPVLTTHGWDRPLYKQLQFSGLEKSPDIHYIPMVLKNAPNIIEDLPDIHRKRFLGNREIHIYDNGYA